MVPIAGVMTVKQNIIMKRSIIMRKNIIMKSPIITVVPVTMAADIIQAIIIKREVESPAVNQRGFCCLRGIKEDNVEKRRRDQLCHGNVCGYGAENMFCTSQKQI